MIKDGLSKSSPPQLACSFVSLWNFYLNWLSLHTLDMRMCPKQNPSRSYVINLCDVFAVDHGSFPTSLFAVATGEIDSSLLSAQQGS